MLAGSIFFYNREEVKSMFHIDRRHIHTMYSAYEKKNKIKLKKNIKLINLVIPIKRKILRWTTADSRSLSKLHHLFLAKFVDTELVSDRCHWLLGAGYGHWAYEPLYFQNIQVDEFATPTVRMVTELV